MLWRYESCLRQGTSHIESNTNCQDSANIREDEFCIVAAVADGLG